MTKQEEKLNPEEKERADEKMREVIRNNFDYGEGAEVILGSKSGPDKQETITHFFTSRIPKLQIKSRSAQRTIDVEMSSVEEDNQSLLHLLFKKSK